MATNEFLKETLEHFKQQRAAKLEEVRALDITIRQIQMQIGEPLDQPDLAFASGAIAEFKNTPMIPQPSSNANYKPRVDEFFGKSIAEAARMYLEKIGHAMLVDDILKAITSGGCKVGGADPKRTLSITLGQGKREFVGTGGGNYGLRKFYPDMPKLGRPEGSIPTKKAKAKRGAKKAAKRSAAPRAHLAKPKAYDATEVGAAVSEVLGDHQPKSPDEVLAAVQRKVGYEVKKIALYGMLRKKDFEQVGEKYRLRAAGDLQAAEVVQ